MKGIRNGQLHVGHTELTYNGAVAEFNQRVNNALTVNNNLNLFSTNQKSFFLACL